MERTRSYANGFDASTTPPVDRKRASWASVFLDSNHRDGEVAFRPRESVVLESDAEDFENFVCDSADKFLQKLPEMVASIRRYVEAVPEAYFDVWSHLKPIFVEKKFVNPPCLYIHSIYDDK